MDLNASLLEVRKDFTVSTESLREIAKSFAQALKEGLAGRASSLKMLPSFLGRPSGLEQGSVIAIDFGGTNVRVIEAHLDGKGGVDLREIRRFPLRDPKGAYDHVGASASAEALFGFIAEQVGQLARPGVDYVLGHTFSFPCHQTGINQARLIFWTKEIKTPGVEGQDVGRLLEEALARKGLTHIRGAAIINDTVGTLLAAAYSQENVDIASICGTGHNTCYLEPNHPLTGAPMVVNLESGNFDQVPQNRFDLALDLASDKPGTQRLEKMVSGYYLGEIVRRVLAHWNKEGCLPASEALDRRHSITGYNLDRILADTDDCLQTATVLRECFGWEALPRPQLEAVRALLPLVARRSARLIAASYCGVLAHLDPEGRQRHRIAIDGSLYEKMPHFAHWLQQAIEEISPEARGRIDTVLAKDGSGMGAAIAAATAAA